MQLAWTLTLLLLFPLLADATTPEEDEARIEELIRAEKGGVPIASAIITPVAPAATSAVAVAPASAPASGASTRAVTPPAAPDAAAAAGVPYASLKDHIGAKVHVVLKTGAEHYAQLESVDARQITLAVPSFEYTAQFSVPREQIARVELR